MGYSRAGFEVVGVDLESQPRYPFEFHQADALQVLEHEAEWIRRGFDAIHASPPCQRFTAMKTMWNHRGDDHPDLIEPTRALLEATGLPWVMENVPGAPMTYSVMLCGTMFGLGSVKHDRELRRHRWFESSFPMLGPTCQHRKTALGIYGDHARTSRRHGYRTQLSTADGLEAAREAMQMPWATWDGIKEAIPPAYTECVGGWLMSHIEQAAA